MNPETEEDYIRYCLAMAMVFIWLILLNICTVIWIGITLSWPLQYRISC